MNETVNEKSKKPYQKPVLVTYGDIQEITKNINSATPNVDSNPSGNKKTS